MSSATGSRVIRGSGEFSSRLMSGTVSSRYKQDGSSSSVKKKVNVSTTAG